MYGKVLILFKLKILTNRNMKPKYSIGDEVWIVPIACAIIGMFSFSLIADGITSIYMYANYPEYYAAKELIRQIGYIT